MSSSAQHMTHGNNSILVTGIILPDVYFTVKHSIFRFLCINEHIKAICGSVFMDIVTHYKHRLY